MPDDTMLSAAAQQVIIVMHQQIGEEITRSDLRDRTRLTDSDLLAALGELQHRRWVEHTGLSRQPVRRHVENNASRSKCRSA